MTNWNLRVIYGAILFQITICLTIVIDSLFKQETGNEVDFCISFLGVGAVVLLHLLQVQKQMNAEHTPSDAPVPTASTPHEVEQPLTDQQHHLLLTGGAQRLPATHLTIFY